MNMNFRHEIDGEKVITAIAQDYETKEILMTANMNLEALNKTIETGKAHYWSTSRKKIWLKGESSGHVQEVKEILVDCDMDAVILKVNQNGAACHKGYYSCFFRKLNTDNKPNIIELNNKDVEVISEKLFNPEDIY